MNTIAEALEIIIEETEKVQALSRLVLDAPVRSMLDAAAERIVNAQNYVEVHLDQEQLDSPGGR